MVPAGGGLVRLLATVAAFMTATSGVPRVRCVCPDGRVKFFCPGPSASGCCCTNAPAPHPGSARVENPRSGGGGAPACCARAGPGSTTRPTDGCARAVAACGCATTVVTDLLAYTAKDECDGSRAEADASVAREATRVIIGRPDCSAQAERRGLLPPPDLVVLFCHFTC